MWAGWFPVVLAVIGAIAALIYSVRGDNVVSVANTGNTGAHMTQATSVPSYAPSLPQLYQPAPIPPVQARVEHYAVRPSNSPWPGYAPTREQAAMAPTVATNEILRSADDECAYATPAIPRWNPGPEPSRKHSLSFCSKQRSTPPGITNNLHNHFRKRDFLIYSPYTTIWI